MSYIEIKDKINGYFEGSVYKEPVYETASDVEDKKYYYFLRPFPVEGQYILEIFTRCDETAEVQNNLNKARSDLRDLLAKEDDLEKEYNNIMNGQWEKEGFSKDDPHTDEDYLQPRWWYRELLTDYNYLKNKIPSVGNYYILNFEEIFSTDPSEAAFVSGVLICDNLIDDYDNVRTYILGSASESDKRRMKTSFEKEIAYFTNNTNSIVKESASLYILPTKADTKALQGFNGGRSVAMTTVKNLLSSLDSLIGMGDKVAEKKADVDFYIHQLESLDPDKEFIAYKLLNRNPNLPDEEGLYREIIETGNGTYELKVHGKGSVLHTLDVDNRLMYTNFETPDRYFIFFDKDKVNYTVYCNRDGIFQDTEGILSYVYKEGTSCTLGNEFNPYECESIGRYKTTFKYLRDEKVFRTKCVDSKVRGELGTRYSFFDAKKPYPMEKEEIEEEITKAEWEKLPPEQRKLYHKKGSATQNLDVNEILTQFDNIKPLLTSITPISQVLGPLEPLVGALKNVQSTADTINSTVGSFKSAVDSIASAPIVGVVAAPFKMLLNIVTGLAQVVLMLYIKNFELIQKVKDIKEQIDSGEIVNKLQDLQLFFDEKLKSLEELINSKKNLEVNSSMKENDKTKMNVFSSVTADSDVEGTGESAWDTFSANSLIPDIPQELLDNIQEAKTVIDSITTTVKTMDTLKDIGQAFDDAMNSISTVTAVLTGTPPMEMIIEKIRTEAKAKIKEKMEEPLKEIEKKAEELKKKANEKKYVKTKTVPVDLPLSQVIDSKEAKEKAIPKVES